MAILILNILNKIIEIIWMFTKFLLFVFQKEFFSFYHEKIFVCNGREDYPIYIFLLLVFEM